MRRTIVQKFGGTSLGDEQSRNAARQRILEKRAQGVSIVVVVSAIGRFGDPYATDTLLKFAQSCGGTLIGRNKDLLLSCGEIISAVIMSQLLIADGVAAVPMSGGQAGILTDKSFSNARILGVDTGPILEVLESGSIPIVAGFQGISEDGEITTLGRGASDTTACALGAALNASCVEIFTDVQGVMTADPATVKSAQLIKNADYHEILALAQKGAKVIHPLALTIASTNSLPLRIRDCQQGTSGTNIVRVRSGRPVTGIASHSDTTYFRIFIPDTKTEAPELCLFNDLAQADISVNFIDLRPREVTFVVQSAAADQVGQVLTNLALDYAISDDYVKVSVVGAGMTGMPGMMWTILHTLSQKQIRVFQSTDSPTSISCLISRQDEAPALNALHDAFGLNQPEFDIP